MDEFTKNQSQFFENLKNKDRPDFEIKPEIWQDWALKLSSQNNLFTLTVAEIADKLELAWPTTRKKDKIEDYLFNDLYELQGRRGLGKQKLRTIVLCIAYLAEHTSGQKVKIPSSHPEPVTESQEYNEIDLISLAQSSNPGNVITSGLWKEWRESLSIDPRFLRLTIAEISAKLNLPWPASRISDTIEDFLKDDLASFISQPGLGKQKIRTIILCVANLVDAFEKALEKNGSAANKKTDTNQLRESNDGQSVSHNRAPEEGQLQTSNMGGFLRMYKHPSPIEEGCFVLAQHRDLGFGKVVEIGGNVAIVEYFYSVVKRDRQEIPLKLLARVKLPQQTRCYVKSEDWDVWKMGRIRQWMDGEYEVDFPEKFGGYFDETEIFVRCNRPIENPLEVLIHKGHETPFFHDKRRDFMASLINQRAAAHGMTGLISSKINLYPHQVEVVRRVLEDPIQRYLLADEVGLGKTIEAGAILRQFLLDSPIGKALILVPPFLVGQWKSELEDKFQIGFFFKRVDVKGTDTIGNIQDIETYEIIILDEAHHIAAKAFSNQADDVFIFDMFREIAHRTNRLLLLSATPVLNNEKDFLAMLHLLDPNFYKLEDLDAFKNRVANRQDIGKTLMAFREDVRPFQLKLALGRIKEIFEEDVYIRQMAEKLEMCLKNTENQDYKDVVRAIRVHISETYRLHRRMLRNRRDSIGDGFLLGRYAEDSNRSQMILEYDLDLQSEEIHDLLEEWRVAALGYGNDSSSAQLIRIFLMLFRYSGTWLGPLGPLGQLVRMRLSGERLADFHEELGDDIDVLCQTPFFPDEREILEVMLEKINEEPMGGDRIDLLIGVIENIQKTHSEEIPPKIVVFTSFTSCAHQILERIESQFGFEIAVGHTLSGKPEDIESDLSYFQTDPACQILICDQSGEEGRNLQYADWIIHFDLPWSPNQLEQRIGRLDRIGRTSALRSRLFVGAELDETVSMHEAWYRVLDSGFRIFQNSIAGLQFYVDDKMQELSDLFFAEGTTGLLENIEHIKEEIEVEQIRVREQSELDEIDALEKNATDYFGSLKSLDEQYKQIQSVSEAWLCDALHFQKDTRGTFNQVSYKPSERTLVPADLIFSRFLGFAEKGTFQREVAASDPIVSFHRIGDDLMDSMMEYLRWDDRGQAYALWRQTAHWSADEGDEWVGFRFSYIIEADIHKAQEELQRFSISGQDAQALRRKGDSLFPPIMRNVYVDTIGECPTDPNLISILEFPYDKSSFGSYSDINLAKEKLSILDGVIASDNWENECKKAQQASIDILKNMESFTETCNQCYELAKQELDARLYQIKLRTSKIQNSHSGVDQADFESVLNDALLEGIRNPQFRLDSVGFIVVSGRQPSIL